MATILARTIGLGNIVGRAVKLRISFRDPKCHFLVLELPKGPAFQFHLKALQDAIAKERKVIEAEEIQRAKVNPGSRA